MVPDTCEVCGQHVGQCYDVHMVLAHPETRPKPEWVNEPKKKSGKKKK